MLRRIAFIALTVFAAITRVAAGQDTERTANVVVILSDDAGYTDFGFQGGGDVRTPHLDALAARGVRCTQGYVLASVCSPSRAGLITGRYPQRFGYYLNLPYTEGHPAGLPTSETTIADRLRAKGYRTAALGKWHLGERDHFHPLERGFDEFVGCLKGSRSYFPYGADDDEASASRALLRGRERLPESGYFTDVLADEAVRFVGENADRPFFLYLSFTAVHTPMHAKEGDLAAFDSIVDERRRALAAMTKSMDDAVGRLTAALEENGLTDDTLVVFLNDNGGAKTNGSRNGELRGTKGTAFEGGIRVPFVVSWPGVLPEGATYDRPVSALDIAPTALRVAGGTEDDFGGLEGVDLVPFLAGEREDDPHTELYWSRRGLDFVRSGDWKLIRARLSQGDRTWLFHLVDDPGEQRDCAARFPEEVERLTGLVDEWAKGNVPPAFRKEESSDETRRRMHLRSVGLGAPNPAALPVPRGERVDDGRAWKIDARWQARHDAIVEAARRRAREGAGVDVVLLGDSITAGWRGEAVAAAAERAFGSRSVHHAAVSGDRTQHVLWRLENGALDGLAPRVVVLMVGTNNVRSEDPVEIAEGIGAIVESLLQAYPDAQVVLQTVLPRAAKPRAQARRQVGKINALLPAIAEASERTHLLDLTNVFVDEKGRLVPGLHRPDALHLTPEGYDAWGRALAPELDRLLR